jgi:UDP-N-acetylmuramyl pentapeptide phosphotransferase/UDP-N-acetylglucosamine-1-phosphate transferase
MPDVPPAPRRTVQRTGEGPAERGAAPPAPLRAAVLAAAAAPLLRRALAAWPGWEAPNARGCRVGLAEGPAFVAASLAGVAAAAPAVLPALVVLEGPVAVAGRIDDVCGGPADRGLRGHLGALMAGHLTSGQLKALVFVAAGLAAGLSADPRPARVDILVTGGLVAASANFVNLLDVVPGRALKAVLAAATAAAAVSGSDGPAGAVFAAAAGAAAALLPADLAETTMLGDAGSNAAGALLGWGCARRSRRGGRLVLLGALAGMTALSETVSLSRLIEDVPLLRGLDRLGRRQ